ncbi:MAG: D-aminoacyl-tRNA deacylase [Cytophagaceae bacterium]|nr:D-aminoacyl-tRNA deacylase [Cytophagaceae bacterium]MDW8455579.1 D-aminoacyl-tRNA deacylase [Cytophagaceae bacterium]
MIAVIQRVKQAKVEIADEATATICSGLLVLLGVAQGDKDEDARWLAQKTIHMRLFPDSEGKMNLSLKETAGELLVVSQFTLCASTAKGNRPSFTEAAPPDVAIELYKHFIECCENYLEKKVHRGVFGADMKVSLINDGPVTIILDTKNKR